jgi:LPS-assembly protein
MRGVLLAIGLLICAQPLRAAAQSPGPDGLEIKPDRQSKFGKAIERPLRPVDRDTPLYLAADSVIEDADRKRVVMQGNVEIYYNSYILTADKMVLDRDANKLTAEGNAQLKAPNGQLTRTERMEATDDLREALVKTLAKTNCTDNPRCMALVPDDADCFIWANVCIPKTWQPLPKP